MKKLIQDLSEKNKQLKDVSKPVFFRLSNSDEAHSLNKLLIENKHIKIYDELLGQLEELVKSKNPKIRFTKEGLTEAALRHLGKTPQEEYGVWVYYPWSDVLIHILDEQEFVEVRTNRNQYKITPEEENLLFTKKIGVIGLSVGKAIAMTIAMERICGELRIADFDIIELSNLNRIQTGVQNFGIKKTVVVAREIAEIDPFLKVTLFSDGLTEENIDDFFLKDGKLDVCVEVCDGLYTKIFARQKAKAFGIPVVMNSSDRGTTDIERYDLHPDMSMLHGLIDHLDLNLVKQAKTNEEKVPYLLPMLGVETSSTRLKASMLEIEQTITTWPQLASGVILGGGVVTDVCRRILLNQFHDSGRYFVDIEDIIFDKDRAKPIETKLILSDSISDNEMLNIIKDYNMPDLDGQLLVDEKSIKELISSACMAPSGANIQSWQWVHYGKSIYLFRDDVYTAGLLDCKNTTSINGLGAASENLVLKAHEMKLEVITEVLPNLTEKSKLIAIFRFFEKSNTLYADRFEPHVCDELVSIIPLRMTNRNIVERKKISIERLTPLRKLAQTIEGADLILIDDEKLMYEIGEVTAKVDRMRIMHKGGHDDFHGEVRWNEEHVNEMLNGVDLLGTVDLTPTELAGWTVVKNWNVVNHLNEWKLGTGLEKIQRKNVASASALGLLTIPRFTNNDFFMAGRALERVWLAANKDNIAVHPASLSTLIFNTLVYADNNGFTDYMEEEARALRKDFEKLFGLDNTKVDVLLLRFFISGPPKTMNDKINIKIKVFRAIDEPELCQQYLVGHREVLEVYGISKITSNNDDWTLNPKVYVITAESISNKELLCGIRVIKVGGTQPLPVESAIGNLDKRIYELVKEHAIGGAGELCGLWNSRKVAGKGLSFLLTRMGISILNQLEINTMFGICAELTLPMFKGVGFEIEKTLGNNGTFYYPRVDLLAYALIMKNTISLECANPEEREKIFELRKILQQKIFEKGPKGELYIEYNLSIPQSWVNTNNLEVI
ncbi:MAG: Rv1355c family protein [Bacteroidetes bacterium]|nr:Rv1355c family protein [Bacteroidota bacterium]